MDQRYFRQLEKGNIGVALGSKSNGLCAIDLDQDQLREAFLCLNPWALRTTEVRGVRGCKFLVRIRGNYPSTMHLKRGKEDVAQWLADGAQAIVSGTHPDGINYTFVNASPPLEIDYDAIVWPVDLTMPGEKKHFTEHKKRQSNRATERTDQTSTRATQQSDAVVSVLVRTAVLNAIPTQVHRNNQLLWQLGRNMKDIENKIGRVLSSCELKNVFNLWEKDAHPFCRQGQSRDEYWFEFLDAYERARFGLEGNPLPQAWEAAMCAPLPQEAIDAVEDPKLRLLISFCREAQLLNGEHPFFIPTRWLGRQFDISHTRAALWLRGILFLGLLVVSQRGTATRCPRFFYAPLRSGERHGKP
jgi:hypothetical protein